MNSTDLDTLAELLAKATPGPWAWVPQLTTGSYNQAAVYQYNRPGVVAPSMVRGTGSVARLGKVLAPPFQNNRDAEAIAALRNAAPELLRLARVGLEHETNRKTIRDIEARLRGAGYDD